MLNGSTHINFEPLENTVENKHRIYRLIPKTIYNTTIHIMLYFRSNDNTSYSITSLLKSPDMALQLLASWPVPANEIACSPAKPIIIATP